MDIAENHATTPSIRASDADRERTSAVLHSAASQGMLTLAEVDERLATLYNTKFRHELTALTEDLPGEQANSWFARTESTVMDSVRALVAAAFALVLSVAALARRHPRITAAVGFLIVLAFAAVVALGGLELDGHELRGAQEIGEH
ncbi:protein of unknown function [Rhodococcoides kyotonense]|uniref:DUF1707 domain-containing protein n=2 Tax=Rhodococcoides kyotonense TaxID=398843 RepID=A0A239H2S2_9NOCA|nr:protein of unknown function [Rhodococcus kyotonensis]